MAKYIEMTRRTRATESRVSKFKNPRVITWHLARTANGYPTFSIALFKEGNDWVRGPAYSYVEIYGYDTLIELLSRMSDTWKLPVEKFFIIGSLEYHDEKLRQDITSLASKGERAP